MHALASLTGMSGAPAKSAGTGDRAAPDAAPELFSALLSALTAGETLKADGGQGTPVLSQGVQGAEVAGTDQPGSGRTGNGLPEALPLSAPLILAEAPGTPGETVSLAPVDAPVTVPLWVRPLSDDGAESAPGVEVAQGRDHGASLPAVPVGVAARHIGAAIPAALPADIGSIAVTLDGGPAERAGGFDKAHAVERKLSYPSASAAEGGQQDASSDQRSGHARAGDLPAAVTSQGAPVRAEPLTTSPFAQPSLQAPAGSPGSLPTLQPPQDLAAIVDRLAAAREAVSPAAASLAVDHAEFGPMTLRFEQQQDGRLSVALSAQDAEAQRALAVALAGERQQGQGSERPSGESPQQSQARSGSSGGSLDRGASGQPGGQAGNQPGGHSRHSSPHQNAPASWRASQRGENGQPGIFA